MNKRDLRRDINYFKKNGGLSYYIAGTMEQAKIALDNCNYYLKDDGILIIVIKSQSIDSIKKSELVYAQEKKILEKAGYNIVESINIHKYAANHIVLIVKKSY